jgi:chemotaxis protein histidine kinase CheA
VDDELRRLLLDELEKQSAALEERSGADERRRAIHSLKGSLGMAGLRGPAEAFARFERRLIAGDRDATTDAIALATSVASALREGSAVPQQVWPEPPLDLAPTTLEASLVHGYQETVHDRLGRIDTALSSTESDDRVVLEIYRDVHTLKGAALAVGDEIMAWFCHGLEEHLKLSQTSAEGLRRVIEELPQYRAVMAEIVEAPDHALYTLRLLVGVARPSARPPLETPLPLPPKRPSMDFKAESDARTLGEDGSVRVATATLDRLFERTGQLAQVRAPLAGNVAGLARGAEVARALQRQLREALRLIGPPRPWGAPALAITKVGDAAEELIDLAGALDKSAVELREAAQRVRRESEAMQSTVTSMRTTLAHRLFEPIAAAVASQARREGKLVQVVVQGGDTPVDRRLAEGLADPVMQLARNAIAHGLETPEVRVACGKAAEGIVTLRAELRTGSLVVEVEDDGAGVDVVDVRRRAIESGTVAADVAHSLPDRTLLSLLFLPGFSMRKSPDLLAGRGVGLDLTLAAVHRLGGTIQLANRRGNGLTATVVVPAEGALVKVVWLECGASTFALPVANAGRVHLSGDVEKPVRPLATLLGAAVTARSATPPRLAIELVPPVPLGTSPAETRGLVVGVDAVGGVEEVALRALSPLVRLAGPFGAGIVWGDELRLSLDVDALLSLAGA